MLQQNNNNNHPCLDTGHRETLHGRKHRTAPFSSALELGAIPLIKGLRAWAISGGYSRSRRKDAPQTPLPRERSWVSQVASGHRKTEAGVASFHTPGVRQGGLGALVTVATLKGSEGSRQTQTKCLFLKAEGCSYLCTVSNKAAGTRGVGQTAHVHLVNGKERRNKDDVGGFEFKPQVIPKWRKSSKVERPMDRSVAGDSKGSVVFSRLEQGRIDKRHYFTTHLNEQKEAFTGTSAITQCLRNKPRHGDRGIQPGLASQNDDKSDLHNSKLLVLPENSGSAKANSSVCEQCLGPKTCNCEGHTGQEMPSPYNNGQKATGTCVTDAGHTTKCKDANFVSSLPEFKELSSGFQVLMEVTNKSNVDEEVKRKFNFPYGESSVAPEYRNPSDSTEAKQQCNRKDTINEDCLTCYTGPTEKHEALDVASSTQQGANVGQCHKPVGAGEEQWCSQQPVEDVDAEPENFAKSPSRGTSFSKADTGVAATSLLNPAPTTSSNGAGTIATAPSAVSKQEEVGATVRNVELQPGSEQEMGLDGHMVAMKKRPVVMDQEEEDDFGVFMQAGEEQIWAEGFNKLQQVPCSKHDCVEYMNPFDANEPVSWVSNWSGVQTSQQSTDSWTAFKQETREDEQKITAHWWSHKPVDTTHLTPSLRNVQRVFLEAFPCMQRSCGDSECIPTLKDLLWAPADMNRGRKPGNLKPWDGLQDLDRMIDLKYKGAESMSHTLVLQSLHFGIPNSEHMHRSKQTAARFSPNLPTSSQKFGSNTKRRLSYDINRNIVA
ncbi:uncharacterized protein LOC143490270 isoform X2 [Brachyhypopomus gauderio]|uniref:uncharacterized protein LOC143490270 isoform X2 n=1 Tax=Brachyhypopomus gauderio TaxID=698409 RepID=UPI004042161B